MKNVALRLTLVVPILCSVVACTAQQNLGNTATAAGDGGGLDASAVTPGEGAEAGLGGGDDGGTDTSAVTLRPDAEAGGHDGGMDRDSPFADGAPEGGTDGAIVPNAKRVFVTSTAFTGDLKGQAGATSGLLGGDALCATLAQAAGVRGTWKAWLSTSSVDAIDRIVDVSPWYLMDRTTLVFPNHASLTVGPLHEINMYETGTTIPDLGWPLHGSTIVWTGTGSTGRKMSATCLDWTSTSNGQYGIFGNTGSTVNGDWTHWNSGAQCGGSIQLYCVEQ